MGLNIKNERVHALAREAAAMTGGTQTSAIELALERLLAELTAQRTRADIDSLVRDLQQDIDRRGGLGADGLYDEAGLPR